VNADRMEQLALAVVADHEHYDQNQWCGTQACLAGHAAAIARRDPSSVFGEDFNALKLSGILDTARKWLDLTEAQANSLFAGGGGGWHYKYRRRYNAAAFYKNSRAMAEAAAGAIRHFAKAWAEAEVAK
jgi:hypothetical protein